MSLFSKDLFESLAILQSDCFLMSYLRSLCVLDIDAPWIYNLQILSLISHSCMFVFWEFTICISSSLFRGK